MKIRVLFLVSFMLSMLAIQSLFAQDSSSGQADMMKKYTALMSPSANHKKLDGAVGKWDASTEMWVGAPGSPSIKSKGTTEFEWAYDGRFLEEHLTADMMGSPMHGLGFTGYDNFKQKYTMFWIDNTSTSMYTAEGNFDSIGTTLTLWGKMDDPMSGKSNLDAKYIMHVIDKDTITFEIDDMSKPEGSQKMILTTYTRKK